MFLNCISRKSNVEISPTSQAVSQSVNHTATPFHLHLPPHPVHTMHQPNTLHQSLLVRLIEFRFLIYVKIHTTKGCDLLKSSFNHIHDFPNHHHHFLTVTMCHTSCHIELSTLHTRHQYINMYIYIYKYMYFDMNEFI